MEWSRAQETVLVATVSLLEGVIAMQQRPRPYVDAPEVLAGEDFVAEADRHPVFRVSGGAVRGRARAA